MIYLDQLTEKKGFDTIINSHQGPTSKEEAWDVLESFFSIQTEDTFVFVSSGAEAISQIYWSVYNHEILPTGLNHMITSNIEEAPILMGLERYNKLGASVDVAQVHGLGVLNREVLEPYFTPFTKFVSISAVNVQTGLIHDIEGISNLCREKGVLLHIDASDLIGYKKVDVETLGADYISIDGTRFGASGGSGALIARQGRKIEPLILDYQGQHGYRGGVFDEKKFINFATVIDLITKRQEKYLISLPSMQKRFETLLTKSIKGLSLPFSGISRVAHISVLQIEGVFNELLIFFLRRSGVKVRLGGGSLQQTGGLFSKVGLDEADTCQMLTLGFSINTEFSELEEAVSIISTQIEKVRAIKTGERALW